MKRLLNKVNLFAAFGTYTVARALAMIVLAGLFCSAAFAETVFYCTADGTLYIHDVGSTTVTVVNNGCSHGPWVVRALPTASGGTSQGGTKKGNAGVNLTGATESISHALAALKALPATSLPTIDVQSPEFTRVSRLEAGSSESRPIEAPNGQLAPPVYAPLIGSKGGPETGTGNGSYRPPAQGADAEPLLITRVTCDAATSVSVNTNYPVPSGSTYEFTNTTNGKTTSFVSDEAARDANGQPQFPLNLSNATYRLVILNPLGSRMLSAPYPVACNSGSQGSAEGQGSAAGRNQAAQGSVPGGVPGQGCATAAGTMPVLQSATGQAGWELVSGPGVTKAKPAVVVTSPSGVSNGGWGSVPGASWVSEDAQAGTDLPNPAGNYTYEFSFCVCQLQGATLALSFLADNGATVYLNGQASANIIYSTTGIKNFTGAPRTYSASGKGLVSGTNTLIIVVNNTSAATGLAALLKVIGAVAGPCPACAGFQSATGQAGWELVSGPGVAKAKPAVVVTSPSGVSNGGWGSVPGASWVSEDAQAGTDLPNSAGDYTYQFSFCICQPQGASIALSYLADNGATVYLNGKTYATSGDKNFVSPPRLVTNSGPFVPGTYTLKIVVHNESAATGLAALLKVVGATSGPCPRVPVNTQTSGGLVVAVPQELCPNLTFAETSRANNSVVGANTLLSLTNNGPGNATDVTVTGISCTNGFVYNPQHGLLTIPFAVPGAGSLAQGATTQFNGFFKKPGNSQTGSFSCTLAYTEGGSPTTPPTCKGTATLNIP